MACHAWRRRGQRATITGRQISIGRPWSFFFARPWRASEEGSEGYGPRFSMGPGALEAEDHYLRDGRRVGADGNDEPDLLVVVLGGGVDGHELLAASKKTRRKA